MQSICSCPYPSQLPMLHSHRDRSRNFWGSIHLALKQMLKTGWMTHPTVSSDCSVVFYASVCVSTINNLSDHIHKHVNFSFCLSIILWTCKMLTELLSQPQTNLSSRLHWNYFCSLKPSVCQQQSYHLGNFVTCIVLHCFIPYAPCPYHIYSYLISDGSCVVTDVDHWTLSFRGQINAM